MEKHLPDGVLSHDLTVEEFGVMFGPVITTEAHHAFAGARVHSNNTAEMSASVEALSFLGLVAQLPVMRTLVFSFDSKHAAGVCLGTIHARTHVQLGLS